MSVLVYIKRCKRWYL